MLLIVPLLRATRRDRVQLRRPGGIAYPADPDALTTRNGSSTCSARQPGARSASAGPLRRLPALVRRDRDTVTHDFLRMTARRGRDPHRPLDACRFRSTASRTRASRATPSPRRCWRTASTSSGHGIYHGRPRGCLGRRRGAERARQVRWPTAARADAAGDRSSSRRGWWRGRWPAAGASTAAIAGASTGIRPLRGARRRRRSRRAAAAAAAKPRRPA